MALCKANNTGDPSNHPKSVASPSSECHTQPSIMTVAKRLNAPYWYCLTVLLFASRFCRPISAQGNFSIIHSTPFSCDSNLVCLGGAHVYEGDAANDMQIPKGFSGRLSLIPEQIELSRQSAGIAYYKEPVRLLDPSTQRSASFSTSFTIDTVMQMYVSPTDRYTGDGLAFVVSADNTTLGTPAKCFGFFNNSGMTSFKSIVVEFDEYMNPGAPVYDISHNHVSFDFGNITWVVAANASDVDVLLWFNRTIYAWVEYSADTQKLELRISNENSRPTRPLLNYTVDLFDVVEEYMWVGFASGTGDTFSHYYIGNWTFTSSGISVGSQSSESTSEKKSSNKWRLIVGICVGVPAFLIGCIVLVLLGQRWCCGSGKPDYRPHYLGQGLDPIGE